MIFYSAVIHARYHASEWTTASVLSMIQDSTIVSVQRPLSVFGCSPHVWYMLGRGRRRGSTKKARLGLVFDTEVFYVSYAIMHYSMAQDATAAVSAQAGKQASKQANKQTSKHPSKQANRQASKQTSKQAVAFHTDACFADTTNV